MLNQEDPNDKGPSARLGWYYNVFRPWLPRNMRWTLRKKKTQRMLANGASNSWPIMESATRNVPENWPGWPEGKRFGLVLTHDVEGQIGVDRSLGVAFTEMSFGLKSSFNFIPEGKGENYYNHPKEVIQQLRSAGFEIGVHDLHHNGALFRSRQDFISGATKINNYLRDWNASGFRAGQMFHRLDWIGPFLDIKYDLSTFDTDPFEWQQDPQDTIFPFALTCSNGKRFVEMPYTLPQDSTVFCLIGEERPTTWIKKLDWIVENGGMVLLNAHPDYFGFGKGRKNLAPHEFNPSLYREFLSYLINKYPGQFWNGLPRELADYVLEKNVGTIPRYSQGLV